MVGWEGIEPVTLGAVELLAVLFGLVWTAVNFYDGYPLVQAGIARLTGAGPDRSPYVGHGDALVEADLPTIDVLLPAYREGNVVHQSIGSIRRADYPQELVNVNVLVEPGDDDTREALADLADTYEFREVVLPASYLSQVVVPDGYPGRPNKPRALNYGFEVTDADLVGVVDAEDVVAPDLFRRVAGALVDREYDYVQGTLDMVNEEDGWLNTMFRAEYGFWYRIVLPAFHLVGYPVPLGGTTNFFRREVLVAASRRRTERYGRPWSLPDRQWLFEHGLDGTIPWDPRNVTEDFELGLLLWCEGYEFGLLDAVTREESPLDVDAWIRQRTRWQKGKLYTFLQYLRRPPDGPWRKLHVLGQSALPHLGPINLAGLVVLAMFANAVGYRPHTVVFVVLTLALVFVVEAAVLLTYGYWKASGATGATKVGRAAVVSLTLVAYWLLQWGADLRALRQIYAGNLAWEKTAHHGRNDSPAGGPAGVVGRTSEEFDWEVFDAPRRTAEEFDWEVFDATGRTAEEFDWGAL